MTIYTVYFTASLFVLTIPLLFIVVIVNMAFFLFPLIPGVAIPVSLLVFCVFLFLACKAPSIEQRDVLWSKAKIFSNFLYVIWVSIFLFGLLCWFGSIFLHVSMPSPKCLFPLSVPEQIVVNSKGDIYCVSRFYNRLQVFNSKGEFLRGWFINLPAGKFDISVDTKGDIYLFAKNNRKGYKYSNNGKHLEEISNPYSAGSPNLSQFTKTENSFGEVYSIQNQFLFPEIIKTSSSGHKTLLYRQPFGLWLVTMPIPGFILFMILLLLEKPISRRIKSRKSQ
jgi:hypothetical protein